jgi:uncharacterized DUF497 family protein
MPSFDWDPDKAARNLRDHNVSFEAATRAFEDEIDDREDYGEERSNVIGMADGRLLVVTYTLRSGATRVISARLAEPRESRRYHEAKR